MEVHSVKFLQEKSNKRSPFFGKMASEQTNHLPEKGESLVSNIFTTDLWKFSVLDKFKYYLSNLLDNIFILLLRFIAKNFIMRHRYFQLQSFPIFFTGGYIYFDRYKKKRTANSPGGCRFIPAFRRHELGSNVYRGQNSG